MNQFTSTCQLEMNETLECLLLFSAESLKNVSAFLKLIKTLQITYLCNSKTSLIRMNFQEIHHFLCIRRQKFCAHGEIPILKTVLRKPATLTLLGLGGTFGLPC